MSFTTDLQSKNITLYPVVEVDGNYYSTNNTTFNGNYCKPLLLNIPSIKQSTNIDTRTFKISNVTLNFSNIEYERTRFSDLLIDKSFLNIEATIYFVTQNSSELVYKGIIRRITHDDIQASVELEDITEKNTHKDIPSSTIPTGYDTPVENRGKPIPMVYGCVDKSPVKISAILDEGDGDIELAVDDKEIHGVFEHKYEKADKYKDSGLLVYNNVYASVNKETELLFTATTSSKQFEYIEFDNKITIPRNHNSQNGSTLINKGYIELTWLALPTRLNTIKQDNSWGRVYGDIYDQIINPGAVFENNLDNVFILDGFNLYDWYAGPPFYPTEEVYNSALKFIFGNEFGGTLSTEADITLKKSVVKNAILQISHTTPPTSNMSYDVRITWWGNPNPGGIQPILIGNGGIDNGLDAKFNNMNTKEIEPLDGNFEFTHIQTDYGSYEPTGDQNRNEHISSLGMEIYASYSGGNGYEGRLYIAGFGVFHVGEYESPTEQDYYANVIGRIATLPQISAREDVQEIEQVATNPIEIIYDILVQELGLTADDIDYDDYNKAVQEHNDWHFGFTITEKINSKELIEDIAKSTKCLPYFGNDGKFKFNTIKDAYSATEDYTNATEIKANDVIRFSFKKTKPENIYKKINISYNYDYGAEEYTDYINLDLGADEFYNITDTNKPELDLETPYIRKIKTIPGIPGDIYENDTANKLATFLAQHYKNDHLLLNLTVPLQYIELEVGQLIKFRELLGGVKAYGIDYRKVTVPNTASEQYYYPLFVVTSIQKNLNNIKIECMQLHHLAPNEMLEGYNTQNTLYEGWFDIEEGGLFNFQDTIVGLPGDIAITFNHTLNMRTVTYLKLTDDEFTSPEPGLPDLSLYKLTHYQKFGLPFWQMLDNLTNPDDMAIGGGMHQTLTDISTTIATVSSTFSTPDNPYLVLKFEFGSSFVNSQKTYYIGDIAASNQMHAMHIWYMDENFQPIDASNEFLNPSQFYQYLKITNLTHEYQNTYNPTFGAMNYGQVDYIDVQDYDTILRGDINQDGILNVIDIVSMVTSILNLETSPETYEATMGEGTFATADMNEDNLLNVIDIVALTTIILEQA